MHTCIHTIRDGMSFICYLLNLALGIDQQPGSELEMTHCDHTGKQTGLPELKAVQARLEEPQASSLVPEPESGQVPGDTQENSLELEVPSQVLHSEEKRPLYISEQ